MGYFEVTWYETVSPAKISWAANITKYMTSEGNSALLPGNRELK